MTFLCFYNFPCRRYFRRWGISRRVWPWIFCLEIENGKMEFLCIYALARVLQSPHTGSPLCAFVVFRVWYLVLYECFLCLVNTCIIRRKFAEFNSIIEITKLCQIFFLPKTTPMECCNH